MTVDRQAGGRSRASRTRSAASEQTGASIVKALAEDPELAAGLDELHRSAATRECIAAAISIGPGRWSGEPLSETLRDGIGLLVLDGLLLRRVGHEGRFGAELLGAGDLLRTWEHDGTGSIPFDMDWKVLAPSRFALLDRRFAMRAARYPAVGSALVGRALRRARTLAANMAIVHQPRVDVRLQMLFWQLADRWGRVHPDGIRLRLPLTHDVLADLVAARRPTVSTALAELAHRGLVERAGDVWCLYGDPPGELEMAPNRLATGRPSGSQNPDAPAQAATPIDR